MKKVIFILVFQVILSYAQSFIPLDKGTVEIDKIIIKCPLKPDFVKKDFGYNQRIVFSKNNIFVLYRHITIWIFDTHGNYIRQFSLRSLPWTNKYMTFNITPIYHKNEIGIIDAYPRFVIVDSKGKLNNIFYIPPDLVPYFGIYNKNNLFLGELKYRKGKMPVAYKINMTDYSIDTLLYLSYEQSDFLRKVHAFPLSYTYISINPKSDICAISSVHFPDIWIIDYDKNDVLKHNGTPPLHYRSYSDTINIDTLQGIITDWLSSWTCGGPVYWYDEKTIVRVRGHMSDTFYIDIYDSNGNYKKCLYSDKPLVLAQDGYLYILSDINDKNITIERRKIK